MAYHENTPGKSISTFSQDDKKCGWLSGKNTSTFDLKHFTRRRIWDKKKLAQGMVHSDSAKPKKRIFIWTGNPSKHFSCFDRVICKKELFSVSAERQS